MKISDRILIALLSVVVTALLGIFFFWSLGVKWIPGEQLGKAVAITIMGSAWAAFASLVATTKSL